MNLELLDPFRRQIPDRVDATLSMPSYLHTRNTPATSTGDDSKTPTGKAQQQQLMQDDEDWKAAYHVQFNRRGAYMAVGYASGLVGVHDVQSRTLNAIYRGDNGAEQKDIDNSPLKQSTPNGKQQQQQDEEQHLGNGVTSVSWSRRSRTLLAGATGDTLVRLYDTTHPYGPEECTVNLMADDGKDSNADHNNPDEDKPLRSSPSNNASQISPGDRLAIRRSTFSDVRSSYLDYATEPRILSSDTITFVSKPGKRELPNESAAKTITRYPALHFHLPNAVGGSIEVHPRITTGGLAVLSDGSLVLFWIPEAAWCEQKGDSTDAPSNNSVRVWTLWNDTSANTITCASFDPQGQRIYAATREGNLLGFEVGSVFEAITSPTRQQIPVCEKQCHFTIRIPGGATVWHLIVSRDGKNIIINCADGALRLYTAKDCWESPEEIERPVQVFQDVVNKIKFASCAVSGDAEYVVGAANGVVDNKYELYIWNLSTGGLMDKLTGAAVQLYSVAWHPTRSFLAVATSDGLIDVWGPRINWTAFAPDFQALPMNVEYVEREDEFDYDMDGNNIVTKEDKDAEAEDENAVVDVVTVEPVPVFASDSEDEEGVFHFETKFTNIFGGRVGRQSLLLGKAAQEDG